MNRALRAALPLVLALAGCGEHSSDLEVERLPDVQPNLPPVPTLPPPPHPVTWGDGSHSVYGVRARLNTNLDTELNVTGYIVHMYLPPEDCEDNPTCHPSAPHLYIADTNELVGADAATIRRNQRKLLMVVGYAENQAAIDEAVELARRGRYEPPDPESGLLPVPTDFTVGNKIKVTGRFARNSGAGFSNSLGLLDYAGHETLEAVESND